MFADIAGATNALRSMQDFPFFDKPMVRHGSQLLPAKLRALSAAGSLDRTRFELQKIEYAKTKSDAVAKTDGSLKDLAALKKERKRRNEVARGTRMARVLGCCCYQSQFCAHVPISTNVDN